LTTNINEQIDEQERLVVEEEYGADQIDALEGLEAVRKRPGMYIGSTSQKGVTHLVWEVADNSIDEYVAGHGQDVWITVAKDASVTIKDNGRGMPVGPHKKIMNKDDGLPMDTLTVLLTKLHAGGKFNKAGSGYKVSAGLHGVGVKAVNALSDLTVVTVRSKDGNVYQQKFSKGDPLTRDPEVIGTWDQTTDTTGTEVYYHPDGEIFKQTLFPNDKALQDRIAELASLNSGIRIHYKNEESGFENTYYSKDGIVGYARKLVAEDAPLLYDDVVFFKGGYDVDKTRTIMVEIAFIHDDDVKGNETIKTFANNINTYEGGFHLDGFRTAYRRLINKYGIDNKLIKENLSIKYLTEGLNAVVSVKVPEAEFEGQTKTKLGNAEAQQAVDAVFEAGFNQLAANDKFKAIFETVVLKSIKAKEADEAARKARAAIKQGKRIKKMALPGKLADCSSKGYSELFIVEGDSAGGSAKQGRNREFQAILALRGKLLNVEKSTLEKLLKSDTITNIIGAIGTGIKIENSEIKKDFGEFDLKKARYEKVVIMTDADVDGAHIKALILTLFYNYLTPLIEHGYVYIAQPPLYRAIKKNDSVWLKDDKEKNDYVKKNPNVEINRFKGLGEMNPDQLWETTMDPEKRTLVRVTMKDAAKAAEIFANLMGTDAKPRRDFIESNAYKVDLSFT
jgi:DNA gyrase subunit B